MSQWKDVKEELIGKYKDSVDELKSFLENAAREKNMYKHNFKNIIEGVLF